MRRENTDLGKIRLNENEHEREEIWENIRQGKSDLGEINKRREKTFLQNNPCLLTFCFFNLMNPIY